MMYLANKKNKGVGLVELMISVTIGLLILAGVIQLYATSSSNASSAQSTSLIQENMRYVLSRIGDDIAQAGNIKCATTNIENVAYSNNSTGAWEDFEDTYVSGTNIGFDWDKPFTTSDTLIVKRVDYSSPYDIAQINADSFVVNEAGALVAGDIVVAGDCGKMMVFTLAITDEAVGLLNQRTVTFVDANEKLDDEGSPILYAGSTGAYTYSIGNSTNLVCSDTDIQNCSLYVQKNDDDPEEVARGVHSLQIRYGVEMGGGVVYTESFNAGINYKRIDRVEVTLQFNSANTQGNVIKRSVTQVFSIRSFWG
jgi:type IV pilus assembly protein PilW